MHLGDFPEREAYLMSKKRAFLKILAILVMIASVLMLALTVFTCVLLYSSSGKTFTLFGNRYAAVEMTGDPGYPRGSLIRLQQGSIPENTPVAVDAGGIVVLSDNRLDDAAVDGKPVSISREQILGAVNWSLPGAGWLLCWVQTGLGAALCLTVPALLICVSAGVLIYLRPREKFHREKEEAAANTNPDPFPDLDYRLGTRTPSSPAAVKTVVITQTRPASSAIRNQKGEVRIYASGQETVLPLSVGRRVVSLGGYQITVEISQTGSRTEDITRELPALRRNRPSGQATEPDTREITIIRPQEKSSDQQPNGKESEENKDEK